MKAGLYSPAFLGAMMTEKEFNEYIEYIGKTGIVLGLGPITQLLEKMGNPQDDLKFVHIAGTNGKGSILAFTSSILKSAGYRVGRYLSPVITQYREKIQVNEKMISKNDLFMGMEYIKGILDEMEKEGGNLPTLFEVETALAFWYFKKKGCDIVVLECGMGGATDATNVIKNTLVCAFASISFDHKSILGNTLSSIATVKAGIMKKDAKVVSIPQDKEVMEVLSAKASDINTSVRVADDIKNIKYSLKKQSFDYKDYKKLEINLLGKWQPSNAAVAVEIAICMNECGYKISEKAIREGLINTTWIGRFNIINNRPLFIMDGAHNPDAALKLRESIDIYLKDRRIIFIVGVLGDKEYDKVLGTVIPIGEQVITITPPNNKRALSAYDLAVKAREYNEHVTVASSIEEAVEMASLLAGDECVIIAFGSLSYLGKLKEVVDNRKMLKLIV